MEEVAGQDPPQQSAFPGDPVEDYYRYLKKAGADVAPDVNSFRTTLSDPASAKQYYSYLRSNHFDAPDTFDSFAKTLGISDNKEIPASGPTQQQTKSAIRDIRSIGGPAPTEAVSVNPYKLFPAYEKDLQDYQGTSKMLDYAKSYSSPQQEAIAFAPVPGAGAMPADMNESVQLRERLPELQQQADLLKSQIKRHETDAKGIMNDLVNDSFLKNPKQYTTSDGTLDYGKILSDAQTLSSKYGGGKSVAESIYHLASSALQFQQDKPGVDAEFKKQNGMAPEEFLKGSKSAGQIASLQSSLQNNFEGEAKRSQDLISKKANDIFSEKYEPVLQHTAELYGYNSEQFKQAYAGAQQSLMGDLRDIQTQENARLLRIRSEQSRMLKNSLSDIQDKNQDELDNFNTRYNQAYQSYLKNISSIKQAATTGMSPEQIFGQTLWSGLNSWSATRGAGLVAAGFNNPLTNWLRSRQTAAESSDIPDAELSGMNLLNPSTYLTRAGRMVGGMLPDAALTMLTKNPVVSGLEFTGSSTLSGMGDVYNQGLKDGYTPREASEKAMDFAHKNFIATLPGNLLMGSAILANLKGAGGAIANISKEVAGGLGAALPQQYLTQAESKEGKTLSQFIQEDAPKSALENVVALAAGAPIMRAVGNLTRSMGQARVNATDRQLYSDIIDKQGPNAAGATTEMMYLNGVLDQDGLAKAKQQIAELVNTKAGLSQLGVHPDYQKLFLQEQSDIQGLRHQMEASPDETMKKLLSGSIKEKEAAIQDMVAGKAPYIKFTTPTGTDFVVAADKAEQVLADPALQRSLAEGHIRAQAFGDEKDVAALSQRINDLSRTATAAPPESEVAAPEKPQITEIRHSETDEDRAGKVSGPDGIPLNANGIKGVEDLIEDARDRGFTKIINPDTVRGNTTGDMISNSLGVPRETIPGFNSWDVGQWDGTKESDYQRAEHYFVNNPDATEYEGKRINESFNQYKDRIIKARQELEDKNQGNTLLVNHSSNINVWDAYQKSGGVWDEAAKQHYLTAPDAEPVTLPPTKEQEQVASEAEAGTSDATIAQHVQQELMADNPNFANRPPEMAHFYEKFKGEIGSVKDSSLDFRVNIPDLTQEQREGAVKDIEAGKISARSTKLLDSLQAMHQTGTIDYTRGRGDHVEKFGIPVSEYDRSGEEVAREAEGWQKAPQHVLDLFDEEIKHLGNEKANESAGPVQSGSEAKAGDRGDDAAPGRSEETAADQKRVSENDQAEGREAAPEGRERQPLPDRFGTRDEFERALKDAARHPEPVDKLASSVDVGDKSNSLEQYKTKAEAVQKQLFPDHSIRWYDTEAEYMDKEQRPAGSAGVYDPKGKYLAFNLERIRAQGAENTIFHEVIHPIVHEALQSRPGAVDEAYSKLVGLKDVTGMDAVWRHEDQYRDRGLSTMKVEAITEFLTHIADGRINPEHFTPSIKTRLIDAVNRVFKALGINKIISTGQDIGRLAQSIKTAFDAADAGAVKQALGRAPEGGEGHKMDAIRNEDSPVRKLIQRAPESMSDDDIRDAVMQSHGWEKAKTEAMIRSVRTEQQQGLAKMVDDMLAKGNAVKRAAQAAKIKAPNDGRLGKKFGRWFMDKQDDVSDVKGIIRQRKGEEEWELDKQWKASEKSLNDWNNVPTRDQLQFILGMERPDLLRGASQQTIDAAKAFRDRMDHVYDVIKSALPSVSFVEDYFPHFWDKPDEVKNYFASTMGKSPMEGSKSFAKQRFYETIQDGYNKGYKLTTTNPEELVRLAEANAWKFKTARNIFDDMQKMGYLKYSTSADLPSWWKGVDDKLFNRIGAYVNGEGEAKLAIGQYMMPPDVAKLLNEHLSLGLKGPVADFVRNYNNIKNIFQLGLGAFHFGTTSLESTVSGVARGIQLLSTLNPSNMGKGLMQIAGSASFVPNLALDLRRGWKAISDYHAGLKTDDVTNLIAANARVGRQKMYSLDAKYNMMKAFGRLRADADFSQIPKATWNALLYLPESLNKFLMEKWVPGLKVGGYLRGLDAELSARKDMSPAQIGIARQKIWDSQDDRLGQVVYDNRFINKVVKDLGFMSVRSLGWTGGTLSAGAKGAGEIPLSGKRIISGEGLTQRTAYLLALPMTIGLYGAYYMAMQTGKWPETAEDYFFPQDGTMNPDGTAHRVALPSYMKDVLAYLKSPASTLVHKTSPILNDIAELYQNKDFYGEQIYGKDDPFFQRGLEKLQYLAGNLEPFSFKQRPGEEKSMADQFATRQGLEQKFGIMPAPKERERTPLENKIMAAVGSSGSEEGKTHEEMEQIIARRHLREFLHNGGSWQDASDELKQKANVSDKYQNKFIEDSQIDPYERYFKGLKHDKKIELWQQMTDDEKEKYRQYMPEDYDAQ